MYFREMRYVYEVYKHRNFSKAAEMLKIAQPTLSLMIKKAESRLGGAIFDRSKSPLGLTDLGRAYIQAAIRIIQTEDEFGHYLNASEQCPSGLLTLGGTPLFITYVLPPLITAFSKRYPGVEIRLHEHPSYMLEKDLNDGVLDLAMDNAALDSSCFDRYVFQSEEVILVVPRKMADTPSLRLYYMTSSYIQHGGITIAAPVPLRTLKDVPFILLRKDSDTRIKSDKLCLNAGFEAKVLLQVDQQITAYNMAAAGLGAAFISDTLVKTLPHDERVMFFRLDSSSARRDIYFYHRKNHPLSAPASAFLNMFENYQPQAET